MPTIGSFSQDDLFGQEGTIETVTLKAKVKFVPLKNRSKRCSTTLGLSALQDGWSGCQFHGISSSMRF